MNHKFELKTEKRTSLQQLTKDFGEFPPYPLKSKNFVDDEFKIHTTGSLLKEIRYRLWFIKNTSYKEVVEDILRNYVSDHENSLKKIDGKLLSSSGLKKYFLIAIKYYFSFSYRIRKPLDFRVIPVLLPILMPIIFLFRKNSFIKKNILGAYYMTRNPKREVNIFPEKDSSIESMDYTISHEHIHLLQAFYFKEHNMLNTMDKHKNNKFFQVMESHYQTCLYFDQAWKKEDFHYLSSFIEIEPRAHDLVSYIYRKQKKIPDNAFDFCIAFIDHDDLFSYRTHDTLWKFFDSESWSDAMKKTLLHEKIYDHTKKRAASFIEIMNYVENNLNQFNHSNDDEKEEALSSNNEILGDSNQTLNDNNEVSHSHDVIKPPSEKASSELEWMFNHFPPAFLYDFICEVLPLIYTNLLKYYGDDELSELIAQEIPRPNLYDQLYV